MGRPRKDAGNPGGTAVIEKPAARGTGKPQLAQQVGNENGGDNQQQRLLWIGEVFSLSPDGQANIYIGREMAGTRIRSVNVHTMETAATAQTRG